MAKKSSSRNSTLLGDIFELPVDEGFAYLQLVFQEKRGKTSGHGDFVRVFAGTYTTPLNDPETIVQQPEVFSCFFPATAAWKKKWVRKIGHCKLPPNYKLPTAYKHGIRNPITNETTWIVTDAKTFKTTIVPRLTNEIRKLPMRGIAGLELVVERIQSGWRTEDGNDLPEPGAQRK